MGKKKNRNKPGDDSGTTMSGLQAARIVGIFFAIFVALVAFVEDNSRAGDCENYSEYSTITIPCSRVQLSYAFSRSARRWGTGLSSFLVWYGLSLELRAERDQHQMLRKLLEREGWGVNPFMNTEWLYVDGERVLVQREYERRYVTVELRYIPGRPRGGADRAGQLLGFTILYEDNIIYCTRRDD